MYRIGTPKGMQLLEAPFLELPLTPFAIPPAARCHFLRSGACTIGRSFLVRYFSLFRGRLLVRVRPRPGFG
jgi:hypothetical protein